jgi:hypothetical protein
MTATLEIKEGNTLHLIRVDEIKALELRLSVGGFSQYEVYKLTPEDLLNLKPEAVVRELRIYFKYGQAALSIESDFGLGVTPEYIEDCYKHLKAQLTHNV